MQIAHCRTFLVARMYKLTKNAKRIPRANVTNFLQGCCTVPDNATPLSFKNPNARALKWDASVCVMYTFWQNWRNLSKIEGRTLHGMKQICYIFGRNSLGILSQFWHPSST